jgi:Cysteine rich repeat
MTRLLLPIVLCTVIAAQAALADDLLPSPPSSAQSPAQSPAPSSPSSPSSPASPAQIPSQQAVAEARAACETDIQKLCSGVQPGGGRIFACLKQHKDQVSDGCKQAVVKATKGPN